MVNDSVTDATISTSEGTGAGEVILMTPGGIPGKTYSLVPESFDNRYAIDVPGASKVSNLPLQMWERNNTNAQRWTLEETSDHGRYFRSANDQNLCLTATPDANNKAKIAQSPCFESPTRSQVWDFKINADGSTTLVNRSFDFPGSLAPTEAPKSGTPLTVTSDLNTPLSRWYFIPS
jgi:hypothetical protein